jgi:uncharacterized protein
VEIDMDYIIVCLVAVIVSALTFFSGFGLGTMLMPAFALFFPVPVAVASTAVVHLANNLFKAWLVGRQANWGVVGRFAAPATIMAMIGAGLLIFFDNLPAITHYRLGQQSYEVTAVKLVIGLIIILFALFDLIPQLASLSFNPRYLPLGGALSGFFGGLSGNQGALRSAFLIKLGLPKEVFIATGVMTAVIIDIARLLVYGVSFYSTQFGLLTSGSAGLVLAATLAAFVGAAVGKRLLSKITLRTVQIIVGVMLMAVGVGLAAGWL